MLPHAIYSFSTGMKSTSIGKSRRTGPGAPVLAVRQAKLVIRGISPTLVTGQKSILPKAFQTVDQILLTAMCELGDRLS